MVVSYYISSCFLNVFNSLFIPLFSDADPPISYNLNFIDKSVQEAQKKPNQTHVFKLSTQTCSPAGDEDDSIAKVLDWFNRSTGNDDWLNAGDVTKAAKSSDRHQVETNTLRSEDSLRKGEGNIINDRKKEKLETKRSHLQKQTHESKEFKAIDRTENKEPTETQEDVKKDIRERMRPQEVKDKEEESEPPTISHLKSFWEKSNAGPKILISKSNSPGNKGQKAAQLSVGKEEEKANKPNSVIDTPSTPGIYNGKGIYDKYDSNDGGEREEQPVVSLQKDIGDSERVNVNNNQQLDSVHMGKQQIPVSQRSNNDQTYNIDYLKLPANPQVADRRGSETEILSVTRLSPQQQSPNQSKLSPESESISAVKPNPQPDSIFQSRETSLQEELSKSSPVSQLDTDLQTRDNPDSEKLSKNNQNVDCKQDGNDIQITPKIELRRGSVDEFRMKDSEDKNVQSSMSPKRKEDASSKDRTNSPHLHRKGAPHQESTAERIKQLKSFWEQERNKPMFYTGKPKALGDGKVGRGANLAKLNKRFTKSEYDLRSIGNDSGSDEEDSDRNHPNFNFNQRSEKSSPSLGTSRKQFNTLREFWDEATSDSKGPFSFEKPKSPKRKEQISAQHQSQELKFGDPELYRLSSAKSPHDRRSANDSKNNLSNYVTAELGQQRESKRSSKDSNREEKATKPQSNLGKDSRSPKSRRDSFSNSIGRVNSLRRATSMFALSAPEEKDQGQLKMDVSPVHSQSRKLSVDRIQTRRLNAEKGAGPRRTSEDSEFLAPRARAFVPRDYRHYLGMTDKTSVHTSLAPAVKDEGSEGKTGYEFDLGGPVRTSTPVSSEERYGRRSSKTSQRPLWTNYSSSDAGQESSMSSTSETWSLSRNSSNREHQL